MSNLSGTSFLAPESRHSEFATKDFGKARSHLSRTFKPATYVGAVAARSSFAYQNYATLSDRVALSFIRLGASFEIHPGPLDSFYLVQIPIKGHAEIEYGGSSLRIDSSHWSLLSPVQPAVIRWSRDCELLEIKIRRTALETVLTRLTGTTIGSPIEFNFEFRGVNGHAESFYQLVAYICQQLEQAESSLDLQRTRSRLEDLILTMVLESQEHNYSHIFGRPEDAAEQLPPKFIALAVDYIASHADESLRLTDIAAASGASIRSLNAGFQKHRHTTPMEFLKHTRLDYVKAVLENANRHDITVTDVALRWGFSHLGRFAAGYKNRFGEHPSETLNLQR
jgi:AraC-like DNA-binding protein